MREKLSLDLIQQWPLYIGEFCFNLREDGVIEAGDYAGDNVLYLYNIQYVDQFEQLISLITGKDFKF